MMMNYYYQNWFCKFLFGDFSPTKDYCSIEPSNDVDQTKGTNRYGNF